MIPQNAFPWRFDALISPGARQRPASNMEKPVRPMLGLPKSQGFRTALAAILGLALAPAAEAQWLGDANLQRKSAGLAGQVIDYTHNHGSDRRIFSQILGMPRDLYVYLPPDYDPSRAYPLVLFLHMAIVDEQYFVRSKLVHEIDELIIRGEFPPAIFACPDGTYDDSKLVRAEHSLFVNGCGGRYEDHLLGEVIPFLTANYSIRPEREAHALMGASAGGYGAMSLAIEHRDYFGAVATLSAPLNLRYFNRDRRYFENFDPCTYQWKDHYDPNEVIGISGFGLIRTRARRFMAPVFGAGDIVAARIARTNPADQLTNTDLQPGQLAIYVNYGGRDNFNFDAQDESFAWLAASRGITLTLVRDPTGRHSARYLRANRGHALLWLGQHLLGPTPACAPSRVK
jgi:poly(3-hydroxybutyrate) depolymerase